MIRRSVSSYGPPGTAPAVPGTQAVSRAFTVLRTVTARTTAGCTLAHVVQQTGLSKPTAHRLLLALAAEGMIEHDERSGRYYIGSECCVLGAAAMRRFSYKDLVATSLVKLAQDAGDSAFFCLRSGNFSVCVLREEGDYWLQSRVLGPSTRRPLGVGAAGLSMLAALDDAGVAACLDANRGILARQDPQLSASLLRGLVGATRARGYAVNEGLVLPGAWGLGVAARAPDGSVLGAFSFGAVQSRLDKNRQRKLAPLLHAEVRKLESHLRDLQKPRALYRQSASK